MVRSSRSCPFVLPDFWEGINSTKIRCSSIKESDAPKLFQLGPLFSLGSVFLCLRAMPHNQHATSHMTMGHQKTELQERDQTMPMHPKCNHNPVGINLTRNLRNPPDRKPSKTTHHLVMHSNVSTQTRIKFC